MSDWAATELGTVASIEHGFAFPGSGFSDRPEYPTVVTPANFAIGGGFQKAKTKTFSGEIPGGYTLDAGSLIVSMTDLSRNGATLGMPAVVPTNGIYLHNQRIGLVKVTRPDRLNRDFLNYYFRTASYRSEILATASGSTVRHTSPGRILAHSAVLPPCYEQRAIAEVLGALDDKIAANGRVVRACDELSSALFAKILVDREQRPLSELADFVNGRAFTKGASGTGRVVIRIAELNSGIGASTVRSDIEVPDHHVAQSGDLLFAWSGSLTVHRWFRPEGIVNQHIFKVIPRGDYPLWLVNQVLHHTLKKFRLIAADKATTMGHIQRRHLDEAVPVPGREAIAANDEAMTALWDRALAAEQESLRLIETRDALLPLLMSGKVRVKNAEKIAEEAL